ncbi:AAEL012227-PA [Aedes aegypti]|uniref:Uncharacterized protein n=2 Tax=Aedes aegypti TaxID=7159 RepID=Q16MP9_AEDAE|nr:protein CDV3 homolog [Aedes aegypti]EAT35618.1 AAEL012227-PA [Aedes aegypti]
MADLDDFFAKKDRKKSKAKKFATPEELAKSIEEAAKKTADAKTARKVTPINVEAVGAGNEQKKPEQADEEWKEFEEERKDYSGLKLAQLTISEQEGNDESGGKDGGSVGDGDGEGGESGSGNGKSGAWRNVEAGADADKQQQQQQQQQQRPGSSVYVTPAMKNLRLKKKGVAPDLKNEEFFPTLGAEQPVDPSRVKKDSTFEEVKHGGRVRASDLPSAQPLQVGNRFTSLSNDAS